MTAWDIHVAEVHQVLLNAGHSAAEYDAHVARVEESVGELLMALPSSPHVSMRVDEFAQEVVLPHLRAIIGDTTAALEGTMLALHAYQEGDELMARRAQYEAAAMTPLRVPGAL
ncbi:MAG: DUF6507 family protein [Ornithinimicrobium sp.]